MKSNRVLRILFSVSLFLPLCQSYSTKLYRTPDERYITPSYFYNELTSNYESNDIITGNQLDFHQIRQHHLSPKHKNTNDQNSDFRDNKIYSSNNLLVKKRCTSWTSPEGIRFVLPNHTNPMERSRHAFANYADCDSPKPVSSYSPSYYSPGSVSNLFYDV